MRLQLIMLETPIIVSDETPEVEDIVFLGNSYNYISKVINMIGGSLRDVVLEKMPEQRKNGTLDYREMSKIIAGISKLPSIDFSSLSAEDCSKIGLVGLADVESFIDEFEFASIFKELPKGKSVESNPRDTVSKNSLRKEAFKYYSIGVRETLKKVQQLNEKKFSLEDIRKAFREGLSYTTHKHYHDFSEDLYVQSLQQPKIFDIEVEMEEAEEYDIVYGHKDKFPRPLITNSQIKITKIL